MSAKVLTPSGFRPIGELSVGDPVVGSDGKPPRYSASILGFKEIYQLAHTGRIVDSGLRRSSVGCLSAQQPEQRKAAAVLPRPKR